MAERGQLMGDDAIPDEAQDYSLIEKGEFKPAKTDGYVILSLLTDSAEKALAPDAKVFAYRLRQQFDLPIAGIELYDGPLAVLANGKMLTNPKTETASGYVVRFRLRQGIN
jgi:hypothetical protein